jgi:anti-sigma factor RsiW
MHGCQGCQDKLLESLYDLLDEAEQQELRAHLAGCPACQAALEQARAQQKLLAAAARLEFPAVQFCPPAADQPAPTTIRPVLLPVRPRLRKSVAWKRWSAAAAILLLVAGLGVSAGLARRDYHAAEQVVADQRLALADARETLRVTETDLHAAIAQRDTRIDEIRHAARARELRMEVEGPNTLQAGVAADYLIRTYDLNGQPAAADIAARLSGPGRGPVAALMLEAREKADPGLRVSEVQAGVYRVNVPPTLRLDPGLDLGMIVEARRRAADADRRQLTLQGNVRLTAPVYLTHLTTDKPMYQPSEVVRFRSLTVDRGTLAPASEEFRLVYTLTLPTGERRTILRGGNRLIRADQRTNQVSEVLGPDGKPIRGVGAGEVPLDATAPGGEWILTVSEEANRFSPVSRKFVVNRYQKPQLDKKLDFNKPSYGPGDEVLARVRAARADGGLVKDRPVQVAVVVDDQLIGPDGAVAGKPFTSQTDADGQVLVRFKLPARIERGQASLAVTFNDGAVVETIVRPIPVVLRKLKLDFFPEGGELVVGLPNRVYFEARTPLGKPAQVVAALVEDGQVLPGKIETLSDDRYPGINQGTGVFTFTPRFGRKYELRIDSPSGIETRYPLPPARTDGVVLSVPGGVFEANEPIHVEVHSTKPRSLLVAGYCRGRLLGIARLAKDQTEVRLEPESGAGGVCRITVFEELPTGRAQRELRPVAERLVYRHPRERADVAIASDRHRYVPGQKANLALWVTDEKEKLTPAILMVAVVDKSVLTLADMKTDRGMPAQLMLTSEIRRGEDLEYADFLIGQNPRAPQALDLLLGTRGWRRFTEQAADKVVPEQLRQQDEASRLLVLIGQSSPRTTAPDEKEIRHALAVFSDRADRLRARHEKARQAIDSADEEPAYAAAVASLSWYRDVVNHGRAVGLPLLAVLAGLVFLVAVIQAFSRHIARAAVASVVAGALAGLLLVVWHGPILGPPVSGESSRAVAQLDIPAPEHDRAWEAPDLAGLDEKEAKDTPATGATAAPPLPGPPPAVTAARQPATKPSDVTRMKAASAMKKPGVQGGRAAKGKGAPAARRVAGGSMPPAGAGGGMGEGGLGYPRQLGGAGGMPGLGGWANKEAKGGLPAGRDLRFATPAKQQQDGEQIDPLRWRFLMQDGKERDRGRREKGAAAAALPLLVREYAHQHPTPGANAVRSDFAETVYWHPVLVLPDGKAEVSFDLCDSVTSFEVTAFAHTLDGRLGAATKLIESRLPFTLNPRVPIEVTATDRVEMALAVANNTHDSRPVQIRLAANEGLALLNGVRDHKMELAALDRARQLYSFRPTLVEGLAKVRVEGTCAPFTDAIEEKFRVVPDGFPVSGASSDLLEKSATHRLRLPKTWIPGTLRVQVDVYPSTLADLQKGLESLLREPHGCFEQSSTANYPNVLILDYLRTSDQTSPEQERRVREVLDRGYRKLTSFECKEAATSRKRGYEWFGGTAPPHEALTAYGLLQFGDMARVQEVDQAMLKRTRAYLLAQRDGQGGFRRNTKALDTFGRAPQHITNAYIVWALTENSKEDNLSAELNALAAEARKSDDPYFVSLVALGLTNRSRSGEAEDLLRAVAKKQKDDGRIEAARTSITGSGGRDLTIETTALSVLAWLKTNAIAFDAPIRAAVKWIGQQRGGYGGFGSTQSTILALKALIAHAKANKRVPEAGELRLYVGDTKLISLPFEAGVNRPLTLVLPEPEKHLKPGEKKLRVEITGERNVFPHTLSWSYRTLKPESSAKVPVTLETSLAKRDLEEGESVRLKVKVKNTSGQGQGMAVAIIGLPGGLSLPEDLKQLKEHCRLPESGQRPLVSAFEVQGRELVLYWRDLAKDQEIEVPIDLVARVPGTYRGPASRAYLYYNADVRHWIEPLAVTIKAK